MKKQSGFTLIELVVAMAVLGLIMGAMVHLFGSSVTSLHVGARQEVVYEEARLLMNELKTTLRYADKDSIDPEQPTVSTSKFSKVCVFICPLNSYCSGKAILYKITVLPSFKVSVSEVTETPEEKMLKEYTSLVSIWHKLKNGEVLTSSERNSLGDFKKFFGTSNDSLWQLGNNDKIREYLLSEKYGGAWFSVNINGKTVYMNPNGYGDTNVPITVDNVFLIGYTDPDKTTGWNVNYVYNPENKKWYHLIKNGGVSVSLPFNKVKDLINGSGWEIVGRS